MVHQTALDGEGERERGREREGKEKEREWFLMIHTSKKI
jgi:hypothetical protein